LSGQKASSCRDHEGREGGIIRSGVPEDFESRRGGDRSHLETGHRKALKNSGELGSEDEKVGGKEKMERWE
jgi:hypothetical protein